MARHLIKANNQNTLLNNLDSGYLEKPYVAIVSGATSPDYNGYSATPFEQQYFTIAPANGGMAYIMFPSEVSYSTDRGATWLSSGNIFLMNGQVAWFKGTSVSFSSSNKFSLGMGNINVYGNIMSLQYGDNFSGQTTLTSSQSFQNLFSDCTGLISAENLVMPATTFEGTRVYRQMFRNCTNLVKAPKTIGTSATTFNTDNCAYMFQNCTSLTDAPELPATTLGNNCYNSMFSGCTLLTTVPSILPATTLTNSCYSNMFAGCTSLMATPALPATILAEKCYYMMFAGCTSLMTAPALSATTLITKCYGGMFNGCSNLSYITCLATDISASQCTLNWVYGVAATGTFVKNANMSDWTTDVQGIPEGWTVVDM